ncbi:MAG: lysylphosphatidylglycerol synthase domain-containing protein, partial [Clostridia bacterium]|nr:lysylphosphatidylglycerol synthase domain-containing protein [Clostridia bacterium]
IMEMKPYIGLEKATATTLTFTVMHVFSHVMLWLTGAFVYLLLGCPGGVLATLADIVVLGLCALALVAFFRSGKRGLVMPLMRLLCRIPWAGKFFAGTLEKKRESFEAIDRDMAAFHSRRRDFAVTMLLEYAGRLLEVGEFFIIFKVMHVDVSYAYCAMALSCASLIGNLVFFIPMQVGSREAGMALALGWMGLAPSISITASLLSRLRDIFYLAVGVGALLLTGSSPEDAEAAASSEGETAAEPDAPDSDEKSPDESEKVS